VGVTGTNNLFLVNNPGVRKETGGSAPFYYPGFCPDGNLQTILGFCCGSPATEANCDKQFLCNSNADCSQKLCCDNAGNCNNASPCTDDNDCVNPTFPTCTAGPGTNCLLEQCDDGNTKMPTRATTCASPCVRCRSTRRSPSTTTATARGWPFSNSVTQDATECVVYQICVNNTGGQDLTGVIVTDTGGSAGP